MSCNCIDEINTRLQKDNKTKGLKIMTNLTTNKKYIAFYITYKEPDIFGNYSGKEYINPMQPCFCPECGVKYD